jgi:hypothetical protein
MRIAGRWIMETYIIILALSSAGLVLALILAGVQSRREKAVWVDYFRRLMHHRSARGSSGRPAARRPLTVIRIDPLELELLLKPPEDESGEPEVKSSGCHLGTRTHGSGPGCWPEVRA